jgi:F-type H+-transporting ATPase subunit c
MTEHVAIILHYCVIALLLILPLIGVSIGQQIIVRHFLQALNRQPSGQDTLSKMMIISMALNETVVIICLFFGLLLTLQTTISPLTSIAEIGILLAIAVPACVLGILATKPAQSAFLSVARQPFIATTISTSMLLTQVLIQTPVFFGLITGIIIRAQLATLTSPIESMRSIAAGLSLGLGCLGPAYGLAHFAYIICQSMGINYRAHTALRTFTLIAASFIETPVLFTFILSLVIITHKIPTGADIGAGIIYIAAAFAIGIGTLGAGIGSGNTASKATQQITQKPELYPLLYRASMISQGLIDTAPLYAVIIALFLVMRN